MSVVAGNEAGQSPATPSFVDMVETMLLMERRQAETRHQELIGRLRRQQAPSPLPLSPFSSSPQPLSASSAPEAVSDGAGIPGSELPQQKRNSLAPRNSAFGSSNKRRLRTGGQAIGARNWLHAVVSSTRFEVFFGAMITLNTVLMALDFQYDGVLVNAKYGFVSKMERDWPDFASFSSVAGSVFGFIFTLEVVLKLAGLRKMFFYSSWNVFDFILVAIWNLDLWIISFSQLFNPLVLRLLRLMRLLRLLRLLQAFELVHCLMLMISSIKASLQVVFWGSILLGFIVLMFGMALHSQMAYFITSPELDFEIRRKFYGHFGTFTRTTVTIYEVSLGNWVPVARLLLEQAGEGYAFMILTYRLVLEFSVVKVVTAVVMHETFKVASLDDELMIQSRLMAKRKFMRKMQDFMDEADADGDGAMSLEEFEDILQDPRVHAWLTAMDLNIHGVRDVFTYIAGGQSLRAQGLVGDEVITFKELSQGLARLRGGAQCCDLLVLMEEIKVLRYSEMPQLVYCVENMAQALRNDMAQALASHAADPPAKALAQPPDLDKAAAEGDQSLEKPPREDTPGPQQPLASWELELLSPLGAGARSLLTPPGKVPL